MEDLPIVTGIRRRTGFSNFVLSPLPSVYFFHTTTIKWSEVHFYLSKAPTQSGLGRKSLRKESILIVCGGSYELFLPSNPTNDKIGRDT
jgi:hypothetical protein